MIGYLRSSFDPIGKFSFDLCCDPLGATNVSKHSIDQSKDRILQINQSKNASKHL